MSARLLFVIALVMGTAIRFAPVESRSMSHPEMWAPLIPVPRELADPGIRATLYEAVTHNLMEDTHPAGYTIAMWMWMKLTGASVWALRLPSILCGVGSIWLLWEIAKRMGSRAPWLAALLLAANGYAAMWSSTARMYAPAVFTVLLSVWLLMRLMERWRGWMAPLYAAVLAGSCSLHVYGWAFAGAHLLWSYPRDRRAAWWQMLAMIVASPLLAFAVYQSFHPVAHLSRNPLPFLLSLAGFGIALPPPAMIDTFDALGAPVPWSNSISLLVSLAGLVFGWLGWRWERDSSKLPGEPPPAGWLAAASMGAFAIIWLFLSRIAHPHEGVKLTQAASAIPFLLLTVWFLLPRIGIRFRLSLPDFCLAAGLAVISAATLAVPMMTLRGLQVFAPFALLPIAEGIAKVTARRRWLTPLIAVGLAPVFWFSADRLATRQVDPVDFREFAAAAAPHLKTGDVILWRRGWDATPMLYYANPSSFRYSMGCVEAETLWEFRFYEQPLPGPLRSCTDGRVAEIVVKRPGALAIRFRRNAINSIAAPRAAAR